MCLQGAHAQRAHALAHRLRSCKQATHAYACAMSYGIFGTSDLTCCSYMGCALVSSSCCACVHCVCVCLCARARTCACGVCVCVCVCVCACVRAAVHAALVSYKHMPPHCAPFAVRARHAARCLLARHCLGLCVATGDTAAAHEQNKTQGTALWVLLRAPHARAFAPTHTPTNTCARTHARALLQRQACCAACTLPACQPS